MQTTAIGSAWTATSMDYRYADHASLMPTDGRHATAPDIKQLPAKRNMPGPPVACGFAALLAL